MRFWLNIFFLSIVTQVYGGSFFTSSPQGIGVRYYSVNVRGLGMGGTGLASPDSLGLTNYSIAKWRFINETRATIGLQYLRFNTNLSNENFTTSTGKFGSLNLAIPLKTHKLFLGISVSPYSNVDFKYILTIQDQGRTYEESVFLNGGISKAQLAMIWSPFSAMGISLNGNYYFGTITDQYKLTFNNSSYYDSNHQIKYLIRGPGLGLSLDYQANQKLNFAGFIDFKPSITLKRKLTSVISLEETEVSNSGSLPIHYGIGSSFRLHPRLIMSLNYSAQNWSEGFGIRQPKLENIDVFTDSKLDDWYQLGIGFERNARRGRNKKFFDQMDLRTGFSLVRLGYKFNNEPVMQYAGHFGIGIPFSNVNRFDFAIAAGIRGNKSKNLVEEKFINFEVSVTVGELWFQKLR